MKLTHLVLVLFTFLITPLVHAGSSGCSNTSSFSWYQNNPYHTFTSSECITSASQADGGSSTSNVSLLAYLTSAPSDGDNFEIKDTTSYSYDVCTSWYSDPSWGGDGNTYTGCQPGGIGMESLGSCDGTTGCIGDVNDGYAQSLTLSEFYFATCDFGDVMPGSNPCTPAQLPSYWSDYPKVRYYLKATYSSSSGNWEATYGQL